MEATNKQRKYIQLRIQHPELPKAECMKLSGYNHTNSTMVEKSPLVRQYAEQIHDAAVQAGLSPLKMTKALARAIDRSIVDPSADSTAIKAVQVAGQLLGIGGERETGGNVTVHNTLVQILNKVSA